MKEALLFIFTLCTLMASGQARTNNIGRNKFIPSKISYGIKANANYHFPAYKVQPLDAKTSSGDGTDNPGGSLGFYFRYTIKGNFSIQPEVNFVYRSGNTTSNRTYEYDSTIAIVREDVSNYMAFGIEIPVYLKWRWEFTSLRRGHYKSKSGFGVFLGPRLVLTPYSRADQGTRATTTLYGQESTSIIKNGTNESTRFSPAASLGVSAGLDYQWRNGFSVHATYYRGLLSHVLAERGFKAYDNRLEVGIGIRFR